MVKIASYVFFDIETTGLPHEERNKTKIIELSFVAALRKDLEKADIGSRPYISKLTILFNPERNINPVAAAMTGLSNKILRSAPKFKERTVSILSFLEELPKPVCLVAHNGNIFDYKILLAEFADINVSLPDDLLCVDSLVAFRRIHKESGLRNTLNTSNTFYKFEDSRGSEDWPDLNISSEDWDDIDKLCSSISDTKFNSSDDSLTSSPVSNNKKCEKISFKLSELYKRLLNKEVRNAHRAEDDCLMLLECVVATKEFFIWTDKYCKHIYDIQPLVRNH